MTTFWEVAARSVGHMFSLPFVYLQFLFIFHFGFKSRIRLLNAPVTVHCSFITFLMKQTRQRQIVVFRKGMLMYLTQLLYSTAIQVGKFD